MNATIIEYECVAPTHRPSLSRVDKLTIHGGRWAFCPFDARADGHEWQATGGADFDTLLRRDRVALSSSALGGGTV